MIKKCLNCGKEFSVPKCLERIKYCSKECYWVKGLKERKVSDDTKKKISKSLKKRLKEHPRTIDLETRKKISNSLTGRKRPDISKANKGRVAWNKGLTYNFTFKFNKLPKRLSKIKVKKYRKQNQIKLKRLRKPLKHCMINNSYWTGKKRSFATKVKISRTKINQRRCKEKSTNWKGGITKLNELVRKLDKNYELIKRVYERDNFTCQKCGLRSGNGKSVILNAHHIKPFKTIMSENNIKSIYDAYNCKELWDEDNLITLCVDCHKKIHIRDKK
ncbi:MAG: HNH endonuclease [Bacteroidia bacterium]|nr:HNH endonuclease [Bacteroidia bacterium]